MKIKDLIKVLEKYSPELDVMVLADEILCYYPLEEKRIKEQELSFGYTGYEVGLIKEGKKREPKWRENNWFYDDDDNKREIIEKKKVLIIE